MTVSKKKDSTQQEFLFEPSSDPEAAVAVAEPSLESLTDEEPELAATGDKKRSRRQHQAATAESMAAKQRDISVSEFFAKNRHLLGFDNPRKALLTAIKEAVDNALDACEDAHILPMIAISISAFDGSDNKFRVTVKDNRHSLGNRQCHPWGDSQVGFDFVGT